MITKLYKNIDREEKIVGGGLFLVLILIMLAGLLKSC